MNISWNAEAYESGFSFVPSYGTDVTKLLTVGRGSRVVDLGCGTGTLTARLGDQGFDVLGIDASEEMLEAARQGHPKLRFEQGDVLDFRLRMRARKL